MFALPHRQIANELYAVLYKVKIMESKKIRYKNPNQKEIELDIKQNEDKGYVLHHSGWINDKFELCFVKE